MNDNSQVIIALCSYYGRDDTVPYSPSEWSKLAVVLRERNIEPKELSEFSSSQFYDLGFDLEQTKRTLRLLDRMGSIPFELEKYRSMGIQITTRAEKDYPRMIKKRMGKKCPPLFYYAGNPELMAKDTVGFVGSRKTEKRDELFTRNIVGKVVTRGYGVVSGGAKGIDYFAMKSALSNDSFCINYVSDSIVRLLRNNEYASAVLDGKIILISAENPEQEFTTATAMARNRYIYAQSEETFIVRCEYGKGGTWNGAADNLKNKFCPLFCWDRDDLKGNVELIKMGAYPIDEDWNADVSHNNKNTDDNEIQIISPQQLSLFDMI